MTTTSNTTDLKNQTRRSLVPQVVELSLTKRDIEPSLEESSTDQTEDMRPEKSKIDFTKTSQMELMKQMLERHVINSTREIVSKTIFSKKPST
jgi:hypothetical protein